MWKGRDFESKITRKSKEIFHFGLLWLTDSFYGYEKKEILIYSYLKGSAVTEVEKDEVL